MAPRPERKKAELKAHIRQREGVLRQELKCLQALSIQADILKSPKLGEEPTFNPRESIDELTATLDALKAVREENDRIQQEYKEAYDSIWKQVDIGPELQPKSPSKKHRECDSGTPDHQAEKHVQEKGMDRTSQVNEVTSSSSNAIRGRLKAMDPPVITFDTVFQGGKADPKDIIVEFPRGSDMFYILRCNECNIPPFAPTAPLMAAAKHLDSPRHSNLDRSNDTAIKHLGIRVLHCTKELAEENNEAYRRWLAVHDPERGKRLLKTKKADKEVKRKEESGTLTCSESPPSDFEDAWLGNYNTLSKRPSKRRRMAQIDPEAIKGGGMFCASNSKSIHDDVVVILPMFEDWPDHKSELLQTPCDLGWWDSGVPAPPVDCIVFDPGTHFPIRWMRDYRNDGAKVQDRYYPAVFIVGSRWEKNLTSLDWVRHGDLREYRKEQISEEHQQGAADYMERLAMLEDPVADERKGLQSPAAHSQYDHNQKELGVDRGNPLNIDNKESENEGSPPVLPPDAIANAASQHGRDIGQAAASGLKVRTETDDNSSTLERLGPYISKSTHKKRGPPDCSNGQEEITADSASRFLAQPGTDNETPRRVPKAPLAAARRLFMESYEKPSTTHRATLLGDHPRRTEIHRTADIGPLSCHSAQRAVLPPDQRFSGNAGPKIKVKVPTPTPVNASTNDSPPRLESDDDDDDSDIPNDTGHLRKIKSDIVSPHMSASFSPVRGGV